MPEAIYPVSIGRDTHNLRHSKGPQSRGQVALSHRLKTRELQKPPGADYLALDHVDVNLADHGMTGASVTGPLLTVV